VNQINIKAKGTALPLADEIITSNKGKIKIRRVGW
jgi:hypothetical protein